MSERACIRIDIETKTAKALGINCEIAGNGQDLIRMLGVAIGKAAEMMHQRPAIIGALAVTEAIRLPMDKEYEVDVGAIRKAQEAVNRGKTD